MAVRSKNKRRGQGGQAAIEMGLTLPFLVFLLYYTLNSFYSIHTAHVGQKYAAMNVYERLDNRAQFAVDDVANQIIPRTFIGVQYTNEEGRAPRRRILLTPNFPTEILTSVGICREPACN
jgi:hypothetical protein